eukprot:7938089-Pyramimonas_sp.AAC.1
MSATTLDACAPASAPVSSGSCIGRSCIMYSFWSNATLPHSSVVYLTTQLVHVCLLILHSPKGVLYALDTFANGVLCAGHLDIINMLGRKQVAARLELLVVGRGS